MASGVVVAGKLFLIEAVSASESQGQAYLYRLLLQEAGGEWPHVNATDAGALERARRR